MPRQEWTPTRKPMSDASKLAWVQVVGPMQAAAQALNAAISAMQSGLASELLRNDGLSPKDYVLDMDRMEYVERPKE